MLQQTNRSTFFAEFFNGINRALGVVAGFLPIAMSYGAIAVQSGLSPLSTVGMSAWVYAGASQFAAVEGVRQNLSGVSILVTMLIINLRHIPMSLSAHKVYQRFSWGQQWILSHGLIDETFALEMTDKPRPFAYYLGMHLCCWASWLAGSWLGCQVGMQLPEQWLQFALPGLFLCLLVDSLRSSATTAPGDRWPREISVVLGVGIALVLITQQFGSVGLLMAILAIAILSSLLPGLNHKKP
ncbi:MAG: branched-chain amino acid ABC transporter permease [Leptolyngbyaceae cyanobacterium SL_5_9]|nr:branched-chain amino acid ABC transporter permease [Leptolyngbyaceae cyanobacterium SL_5_9]